MQTRRFVDADRAGIAQLQIASWRAAYRDFVHPDELGEKLEQTITARWENLTFGTAEFALIVESDGEFLGFVTVLAKERPFIDNLHVRPGLYRSGVGRQLMKDAATELMSLNQTEVHLTVLKSNARARAFYEAIGGKIASRFTHEFLGASKDVLEIEWTDLPALSRL